MNTGTGHDPSIHYNTCNDIGMIGVERLHSSTRAIYEDH